MEKEDKTYSLIFVRDLENKKVLLGMKRRGFGVGKYNGYGGKQEKNEDITTCARRELLEECGITAEDMVIAT